jgi:uncharacterized protein Veg
MTLISDPYTAGLNFYFLDLSVVVLQALPTPTGRQLVYLTTSPVSNFTGTAEIYSSVNDTKPAVSAKIPNLKPKWTAGDFYSLAANSTASLTTYVISRVWTTGAGNAFALSRKMQDTTNGELVSVFSSIFVVKSLEDLIQSNLPKDAAFAVVCESDGSFVGSTLNYTEILTPSVPEDSAFYRSMAATNHTELRTLENVVLSNGGWLSQYNTTRFTYTSPGNGRVTAIKNVYNYANRDWYVIVIYPNVRILFKYSHKIVQIYSTIK